METSLRAVPGLEPMLSIDELSEYLDVPVRTLYDWRLTRRWPRIPTEWIHATRRPPRLGQVVVIRPRPMRLTYARAALAAPR